MKTLFLGSYGYGNLGDELCLLDALKAFPTDEAYAFSHDPAFTDAMVPGIKGFVRERPEARELAVDRFVLGGGGVGFMPSIRDSLHWMWDHFRNGAECHIHNIGVARITDLEWAEAPEVQSVLQGLKSHTVRDDMSWFCTMLWPGVQTPGITLYPERKLAVDNELVHLLPKGQKLLGISITGQQLMRTALRVNSARVRAALEPYRDHIIIPVVSTVSLTDPEEDDVAGFNVFRDLYLQGFQVACEEFLDKKWWRQNLTPLRLKGIIGGLNVLFTQRKHNLIHAIGTQTKAVGIYPSIDDSIARIFFSLRDEMPQGSSQLSLTAHA